MTPLEQSNDRDWNRRALDQLDARVENAERDIDALREDQRILRDRPTSARIPWTTAIAFAGTVIVPILVALIGAYVVLRAGIPAR
jgi:hypothetical protein